MLSFIKIDKPRTKGGVIRGYRLINGSFVVDIRSYLQAIKTTMKQIDIIAELEFLTHEQGGRKSPAHSGYLPHIEFKDYPEHLTSGQQTYIGQEIVKPGTKVKAEIDIFGFQYFLNRLYENMEFKFCEGPHTIGYGKILEVVNPNLKSDPKVRRELINLNLYPKDIIKKIKIISGGFEMDSKIIHELQNLIISENSLRSPRIIRSIIYLFTIEKIDREKVFEMAKTDWRDILYLAEYDGKENRLRDFNNEFGQEEIKASW